VVDDGDDHWLAGWRLDHRIVLAAVVPLVLLSLGGLFVGLQASEIEEHRELQEDAEEDRDELVELEEGFSDVVGAAHAYVLTGDTQNRSQLESRITTFEDRLSSRDATYDDPQQRSSAQAFEENATSYLEVVRQAQGLMEEGDTEAARERLVGERAHQARTSAVSAIEELQMAEQRDVDEHADAAWAAHRALDRGLVVGTLAAIVSGGVVGYDIVRRTRSSLAATRTRLRERLDELSEAREDQRARMVQRSEAMQRVGDHLDDVSTSADDVHERVDQAAQYGEAIEQAGHEGSKRVDAALGELDEARESLTRLTERLLEVGEEFDQVEDVADELEAMAGEVDMLALNASVEASRAGVDTQELDEVRHLAERAQTRAERLASIAANAQTDAEAAAIALEESDKATQDAREDGRRAGEAFEQVGDFLADNRAEAQRVRELAERQREALDGALRNLEEARTEAEVALEGTRRGDELVDELDDLARRLREVT
jgi:CHASE3 domain sensor protein